MTDKEIFVSVVPYKNFMTPTVEGYVRKGDYICEISCGEAFGGGTMVGVTIVNAKTRTHEYELCKSNSYPTYKGALAWAKEYVNNL